MQVGEGGALQGSSIHGPVTLTCSVCATILEHSHPTHLSLCRRCRSLPAYPARTGLGHGRELESSGPGPVERGVDLVLALALFGPGPVLVSDIMVSREFFCHFSS